MHSLNDFETDTIMALGEQTIITGGAAEVITHVPKEPIIIGA
jgi:hypothetical protein